MKLASIVPVKNVDKAFEGKYAMLLAHLSKHYKLNWDMDCYVIMDNSLIELGDAVTIEYLIDAADNCIPWIDEIILPDVYRDGEATYQKAVEAIEWLRKAHRLGDYNLMAVAHGKTFDEFETCFNRLAALPEIHCIAIPKVTEQDFGARRALEGVWAGNHGKQIHLLGVWDSLSELKCYMQPEKIRSVDTCIPALFACRNEVHFWDKRPNPTIDLVNEEVNVSLYDEILKQLKAEDLF